MNSIKNKIYGLCEMGLIILGIVGITLGLYLEEGITLAIGLTGIVGSMVITSWITESDLSDRITELETKQVKR